MVIPGYSENIPVKVLDRGGAVRDYHLDVFFGTHKEALEWGVRNLDVKIRICSDREYLTRLYNIEKDLRFVQDQAGHASPTTTAIYAKTNSHARKRQVQALDEEEF
jgi:integrase